jgi:hypothetical protein
MKIYKISEVLALYCAWCKKLIKGKDVGYDNENVSHGICQKCLERIEREENELV